LAPTVLPRTPSEIEAGSTAEWTRTFTDFAPADGYVPTLALRGPSTLDVDGVVGTSDYTFTVTAVQSKTLAAGTYQYVIRMTLGTATYTVERGVIIVNADPAQAVAGDWQTENEKALARINEQIAKREASDISSYGVAGRSVQKEALKEMYAVRQGLRDAVRMERNGGRLPGVATRMGSAR
jgi:hypothetical protein